VSGAVWGDAGAVTGAVALDVCGISLAGSPLGDASTTASPVPQSGRFNVAFRFEKNVEVPDAGA
jgi:hypothetical protein